MLGRSMRYVCNLVCCRSCYFSGGKRLDSGSATDKKRRSKCCFPWTKQRKQSNTNIELTRKRQFIINELVESEQRYIENLKTLDLAFIMPLFKLEPECKPLGKLCAQIKLFLRFHKVLLNDLFNGKSVPSIFNKTGFFLELTWDYINLYPQVSDTLETLKEKSKTFTELIKNNELFYQVKLSHLLVEPIKRIPKYKLLLQDLQASTPKGHSEYESLEKALKKIAKIILKLKEARESDRYGTWKSVYQQINGRGQSLCAPIRKFVRKDVFWCVFQSEYFHFFPPLRVRAFLFSNCIIICEDQKVGRRYKFLSEISLPCVSSLEYVQDPHISFKRHRIASNVLGFTLSARGHRTFELYHSNHAVLKKWVDLVSKFAAVNAEIGSKDKSFQKTSPPSKLYPNLLFGKETNSTVAGSISLPGVTSQYGSVSRYEPESRCNSVCKSVTSEKLGTTIEHGPESMNSSNESDWQIDYRATSMRENLLKLSKKRNGYTNLSDYQSSLWEPPTHILNELEENIPARKSNKESGSYNLWKGDSFFVAYNSDQEEKHQKNFLVKEVEPSHSF